MNKTTIYIDKENISGMTLHGVQICGKIYTKAFPKTKFLWFTTCEGGTRYWMHQDFDFDDGCLDKKDVIRYINCQVDGKYYDDKYTAMYLDEKTDTVYMRPYAVIKMRNHDRYIRFFESEEEMKNYAIVSGVISNLFELTFDTISR